MCAELIAIIKFGRTPAEGVLSFLAVDLSGVCLLLETRAGICPSRVIELRVKRSTRTAHMITPL